tara:strand:+ start:370 stop:681 length:312 start_codon:yes stop_codon:yes gene_type:complete
LAYGKEIKAAVPSSVQNVGGNAPSVTSTVGAPEDEASAPADAAPAAPAAAAQATAPEGESVPPELSGIAQTSPASIVQHPQQPVPSLSAAAAIPAIMQRSPPR